VCADPVRNAQRMTFITNVSRRSSPSRFYLLVMHSRRRTTRADACDVLRHRSRFFSLSHSPDHALARALEKRTQARILRQIRLAKTTLKTAPLDLLTASAADQVERAHRDASNVRCVKCTLHARATLAPALWPVHGYFHCLWKCTYAVEIKLTAISICYASSIILQMLR
jgi:hypothetical protein